MNDTADPSTIVFRFSGGYRGLMAGLFAAFCCLIAFCIFAYAYVRDWQTLISAIGGTALFGLLAIISFSALSRSRDRISVDDDAITYLPYQGKAITISWRDIGDVEAHEIAQRLTVRDSSGSAQIKLEYQLENFDRLREIVLVKASERRSLSLPGHEFRQSFWYRGSISPGSCFSSRWVALASTTHDHLRLSDLLALPRTRYMAWRASRAK